MPSPEQRLCAGLEALDWRETAAHGPWRRFGKFGLHGGAMYVLEDGGLWFSALHTMEPGFEVQGPIARNILAAGDKALGEARMDTEAMLIELMYSEGN